jgi:hypothetical protein
MRSSRATAVAGAGPESLRASGAAIAALALLFAGIAPSGHALAADARAPQFTDYPAAAVYRGEPAPPDFKRHPAAAPFAAELREGARRGPNFAGYLRVVEWSCGPSCRRWMIVDSKTGRIYDGPEPAFSLEYQLTSRLLVVNTVGRFTAADPPAGVPIANYYVWRNDGLQLVDTRVLRSAR